MTIADVIEQAGGPALFRQKMEQVSGKCESAGEMGFLQRLRAANTKRGVECAGKELTPMDRLDDLLFRSNELAGETGEACNAVKKLIRHFRKVPGGVPLQESKQHIAEELGDIIICADRVADSLEIDLEAATIRKFNLTSDKLGFEVELF